MANNIFLTVADGQSIIGLVAPEEYTYWKHFVNNKYENCLGKGNCPHCNAGNKAASSTRRNIVVKENGVYVPKIWEFNYSILKLLKIIDEEWNLNLTPIKIIREGTQKLTRWHIIPSKAGALSIDIAAKIIASVQLHSLQPRQQMQTIPQVQQQPVQQTFNPSFLSSPPTPEPGDPMYSNEAQDLSNDIPF